MSLLSLTLFFLTAPAHFIAGEPLLSLQSDSARTSGHTIELEGAVRIEHAQGVVTAGSAILKAKEESKESIEEVELRRDVVIQLAKGGRLECQEALLQTESFQGRFTTAVSYRDGDLTLTCDQMEIEAIEPKGGRGPILRQIEATGSVTLSQGDQISGKADRALYLKQEDQREVERLAQLGDPGWWQSPGEGQLLVRIIDRPCEVVILSGGVSVKRPDLGQLESNGSIYLVRTADREKRRIDRITSSGRTTLSFPDKGGQERRLTCHGRMVLDQVAGELHLSSPIHSGEVHPGEQVHYLDEKGEVYADVMKVDSLSSATGFEESHILLTGSIRMVNRQAGAESSLPLMMGVADRLEYCPKSELMTLEADPGNRVVFVDESQDARVSARKVFYDRKSQSIEGVGNVRFSLSDRELVHLRTIFGTE